MLNNMKINLILCLAALTAGLLSQPAWAGHKDWPAFSRPALAERYAAAPSPRISADEAAARVQRQYGGRILAVETRQRNGEVFYRIKVLTRKGVVRVVRINAGSRR
jgi:uncharacterized membrane protein YkoI